MSRAPRPSRSFGPRALLFGGLIVFAAIIVAFALARPQPVKTTLHPANPPAAPAPAPHFIDLPRQGDPTMRTLVIAGPNDQLPGTSNTAGYLMANLRIGQLPANATTAVVRSDANCQPDQNGISHCLNELQVGTTIVTIQHHHNIRSVPCLTPGETVKLMSLAAYQG